MPLVIFWSVWSLTAFVAAAMLSARLIGWAAACGAVDVPNGRSSHSRPTPRGGGIAIVAVTAAAGAVACLLHPESIRPVCGVLLPALAIAAVSWLDDVRSLPNRIRFAVHLGCAVLAVAVLGPVEGVDLGSFGRLDFGPAAWPLTLLWIVGLTNAFNFMDGIDGIAGITAAVSAAALAVAAAAFQSPAIGGVSAAFALASCGFLTCNWPPARIFMGDVGSAFCGFVLAVLPLAFPARAVPAAVAVAAAALWPFIFDTAYTIVRRLRRRENIFQAHRSHLYQRLVIAGWSHLAVSLLYGALSALAAFCAAVPLVAPEWRNAADIVALAAIGLGMVLLLALVFVSEKKK
jgi:UDP-N-acetylmuramyl pentapeptide phosphotransferase/UDP-N-acetylglucosamine-1-phosphate transferase